jgi:phenylalanyl-tRNA synthetase alpha chain
VLDVAGLHSDEHSGLAMGIGLDRMLMLRKGIGDIRALRSADPRVADQMLDLEPYHPASAQPPIRRDLSIAVAADTTPEELGDRTRQALGSRCAAVEAIEVVSETRCAGLAAPARERRGIGPAQKNVLLRIVIRDLERTLTAAEANALRDEIYGVLHEGSVHWWTSHA